MVKHKQLWTLLRTTTLLLTRKLHLRSHVSMKFGILALISHDDELKALFENRIHSLFNDKVTTLIKKRVSAQPATRVLLATAAPDVYVPWIWDGDYVATHTFNNPDRIECRGLNKLNRVVAYARERQLTIETVITDHYDDMPLMVSTIECLLVEPNAKTIATLAENHIYYTTI